MLFAGLLDTLRRRGYTITVDHELRLQRLLPRLDAACQGPEDLRDILCPLFAASKEQQENFGPIFEEWLRGAGIATVPTQNSKKITPPDPEPWYARRSLYLALAPLVLAAVWWASGQVKKPEPFKPKPPEFTKEEVVVNTSRGPVQQIFTQVKTFEQPPEWMLKWERYRQWTKGAAASILLLWLLFEIWRYLRRRMILQRERANRNKAPHRLELAISPQDAGVAQDAALAEAARRMRQRESSEQFLIDLPATIREAVRRAGFLPGFLLRQQTREPVYLMLIDRRSLRDHQMLLFEEYAQALRGRNVEVTFVHFSGDPRYPQGGDWQRLKVVHRSARVLLAADGESLRHPETGELYPWVMEEFAPWPQRALLTPVEPGRWGWCEKELAKVFTIWPATGAGILALSRLWSGERVAGPSRDSIAGRWLPARRWREVTEEAVGDLRADLGEAAFRWLCACAHAPELQWRITQRLAALPEVAAREPREQWRLFSLEWFRQGFIPREWCYRLTAEVPSTPIRDAIVAMFKEVDDKSDAGQLRRLWLQFQRLWPGRETLLGWWRLRQWARRTSPETIERDVVVLRSLDSLGRSPIDLVLGRKLSRVLHERGVSLLGLRTVFRFAAMAATAVAFSLGFDAMDRQTQSFRAGERLTRLDDVYFDYNTSALREDARASLTRMAVALQPVFGRDASLKLILEGHVSARNGRTAEYAVGLGNRRATAVKEFLMSNGLPGDRLLSVSYGMERPVCSEKDEACYQRNERVHFSNAGDRLPTNPEVRTPTAAGDILEQYRLIPKGTFQMGCSPGDNECYGDEKPVHTVTISQDFYMAATEVTAANYARFAAHTKRTPPEETDRSKSGQDHPVVNVDWDDARAYCAFVSGRLPTEAEWEYAARGGVPAARYGPLDSIAWHDGNSGGEIHPVAKMQPNAYGLYDMLGNAWEWTGDWFGLYDGRSSTDPPGAQQGSTRVVRGGSWNYISRSSRASFRDDLHPGSLDNGLGFRCVRPAR